jgi:hypothetical protein
MSQPTCPADATDDSITYVRRSANLCRSYLQEVPRAVCRQRSKKRRRNLGRRAVATLLPGRTWRPGSCILQRDRYGLTQLPRRVYVYVKTAYGCSSAGPCSRVLNFAAAGQGEAAQSTSQVVTTRADQNIYQQYGRDSVYGFSPDRKPQKPEHTAARAANALAEGCC